MSPAATIITILVLKLCCTLPIYRWGSYIIQQFKGQEENDLSVFILRFFILHIIKNYEDEFYFSPLHDFAFSSMLQQFHSIA